MGQRNTPKKIEHFLKRRTYKKSGISEMKQLKKKKFFFYFQWPLFWIFLKNMNPRLSILFSVGKSVT